MSDENPLGVAFVGLGWWGGVLADAALASGAAQVIGGYARTPSSREAFASKYNCRNYETFEQLLGDPEAEVVAVASANSAHKEHALTAAKAGKHIHLEKPMALSVSDAREIIEVCEESGVKLHVGQNFRRWPMFRRAKEIIDKGELGTISFAIAHFSYNLGLTAGDGSMRWDAGENPGGPLYSYTIHLADLMETLFGEIKEINAATGKVGGPSRTDDAAGAVLRFGSGMIGVLSGSYTAPFRFLFDIEGTKAALSLSSGSMPRLQAMGEQMAEAELLDVGVGFLKGRDMANSEQFADLARCIRHGGEPEVTGVHGMRALAVMRGMLRGHAEKRTVTMEDMLEGD